MWEGRDEPPKYVMVRGNDITCSGMQNEIDVTEIYLLNWME